MHAFIVESGDSPGEMARIMEVLAARSPGVLLYCFVGLVGGNGGLAWLSSNEEGCRTALREAEIAHREVPLVTIAVGDAPGEAARVCRRLAEAGVRVELWLPVHIAQGLVTVALGVHDPEAAQQALSEQLADWQYRQQDSASTQGPLAGQ
jgi:hypothetical protein